MDCGRRLRRFESKRGGTQKAADEISVLNAESRLSIVGGKLGSTAVRMCASPRSLNSAFDRDPDYTESRLREVR
ncbi:hypothetical protein SISNIDRAFT_457940 [Sistotremastrum niveocremeum HHB9708]|uniref:Uncharacterized protein n=2 Tax=Sistotremastraceae TaxID=3402574 RepID=A0A164QXN2_9AGAM|nr:hypothetical protein SISNIDRAFT_457940 [Sistotremastrum niveocremeum HHB9708]KZT37301.1 hypothetical protein SISSUDRAFT_1048606 [Sistotremastrum suecicum HHB10207 ss-3]